MALFRPLTQFLQRIETHFRVDKENYPNADQRLRARLVLGFLFFYSVAWSSYVLMYFSLGNVLASLSCGLFGLPSSLFGLWTLKHRYKPQLAALFANCGGALVLTGIIASTGAAASPIYAWFFFVTITAFLLTGKRAGYAMFAFTASVTAVVITADIVGFRLPTGFSFAQGSPLFKFFIAYTYISALFFLALVSHIYHALVIKGMREATDQFETVSILLNNMSQAVFVMDGTGRIKPPVSRISSSIFGLAIENTSVRETLFKDIPRHSEKGSRIDSVLSLAIGGSALQWSTIDDLLPAEVEYTLGSVQKILRCSYRPLYDAQELIHGIMCVIEDVTALALAQKDLQKAREEIKKNTMILEHVVRNGLDVFDGFLRHTVSHVQVFYDAVILTDKDKRFAIDTCLRSVHTIKGNARQLGLSELASEIHDVEHDIVEYLRKHPGEHNSNTVLIGLMEQARRVLSELKDYDRILVNYFKCSSAFRPMFQSILQQALDHLRKPGSEDNRKLYNFFVAECLRYFEARELITEWKQFMQNPSPELWEAIVQRIRLHENIRPHKQVRDATGTLQVATRNLERVRTYIEVVESEKDEVCVRRGLAELRQLLGRLDEVQLESVLKNFQPMIEELAGRFEKRARLIVETGLTSMQRESIDVLNDAVMHIVRNMMDHGLEAPDVRQASGKDPVGTIRVRAQETTEQLEIIINDDGAGIDLERLVKRARDGGFIAKDAQPDREEAIRLIFLPSLSTRDVETEISGRGFGMEAAQAAVRMLGGSLTVETIAHRGTSFTLIIPLRSASIASGAA